MTSAHVAELKNRLSAYLKEVRNGKEVVVMNRDMAIAKIIPFPKVSQGLVIRKAQRRPGYLKHLRPDVRKIDFDPLEILRKSREDRL